MDKACIQNFVGETSCKGLLGRQSGIWEDYITVVTVDSKQTEMN